MTCIPMDSRLSICTLRCVPVSASESGGIGFHRLYSQEDLEIFAILYTTLSEKYQGYPSRQGRPEILSSQFIWFSVTRSMPEENKEMTWPPTIYSNRNRWRHNWDKKQVPSGCMGRKAGLKYLMACLWPRVFLSLASIYSFTKGMIKMEGDVKRVWMADRRGVSRTDLTLPPDTLNYVLFSSSPFHSCIPFIAESEKYTFLVATAIPPYRFTHGLTFSGAVYRCFVWFVDSGELWVVR